MRKPKVSVLLPIYNVEEYLERCLDSVLNQTLTDIEIICVNDGSTDNSLEILKKYEKEDSRVKVVNKKNGGLPSARNAGLDVATGQYVGFVDSDDYIQPNMFEKLYKTAEEEKSDVVICGANIFPEEPHASQWLYNCLSPSYKKMDKIDGASLFFDVSMTPFLWRVLIKKDLIDDNNLRLQEDVMLGEDKAFQCKVYPLAKSITVIPDKLYNYCWYREGSLMNQTVYGHLEKKVSGHVYLLEDISKTIEGLENKEEMEVSFLEWGISFVYDDLISISTEKQVALSKVLLKVLKRCHYSKYKCRFPEWKREQTEYFKKMSKEEEVIPRLSVVVPVDVEAEYVKDMLKRVCSQSLERIEIILVNNGTKDEFYSTLHKALFEDSRICLLNMAHKSYADALNKGVELAKGEYIAFIDTYNWYTNLQSLENWINFAEEQDSDICGSNYCVQNMPGALSEDCKKLSFLAEDIEKCLEIDFQNVLYKTEYLRNQKLLFKESTLLTGLEFLANACLNANKVSWYDEVVCVHRKMYAKDWISTHKCKEALRAFRELMELSVEKECPYLHNKVLEMLNGDYWEKIIVNNTRAFKGSPEEFPEGENSQVEIIEDLMQISALIKPEYIAEKEYKNNAVCIRTLYKVIKERHKFLADLSN